MFHFQNEVDVPLDTSMLDYGAAVLQHPTCFHFTLFWIDANKDCR